MDAQNAQGRGGEMTQNLPALFSMGDLERMAIAVVKSNLFGIKTIEQAITLMLVAQAEGMHPAAAARDYHIIQNRPAMKADAMLARFQQSGGIVEWQEYTDTRVEAVFRHPQSPKPVAIVWTIEMAKRIGLAAKDNWRNYPRQMLRARVVSEGVRTCYPAIATGIYTPEEVQDFGEKNITLSAGAMSTLPIARQEIIIATGTEVRTLLANDQAWDAYAMWQNSGFDNDEKVAFWSQLDSKQRGILGRMRDEEEAKERGKITPQQKKRLEAIIKEFALDREAVKAECVKRWGIEHFGELDRGQYEELCKELEQSAARQFPAKSAQSSGKDSDAGAAAAKFVTATSIGEPILSGSPSDIAGMSPVTDSHITPEDALALEAHCRENGIPIARLKLAAKVDRLIQIKAGDLERAKAWIDRAITAKGKA